LKIIRTHYRNKITETLLNEGNEEFKSSEKLIKITDPSFSDYSILDNYLEDKWEIIRIMDYYKHYFDPDFFLINQVLPPIVTPDKKKRKKKKSKKSTLVNPEPDLIQTIDNLKIPNVPELVKTKDTKEILDIINAERQNINFDEENKSLKDETNSKDLVTTAGEVSRKTSHEDCKFIDSPTHILTPEESESGLSLNAANLEKLKSEHVISTPPHSPPQNLPKSKTTSKKKKNKKGKSDLNNAKKEYEELKARALQHFAASTVSPEKTTKSSAKKSEKKDRKIIINVVEEIKEKVNNAVLLAEKTQSELKIEEIEQNALDFTKTPSTISTPKRSLTPTKSHEFSNKSMLSPLSDKSEQINPVFEEKRSYNRYGRKLFYNESHNQSQKLGYKNYYKRDQYYKRKSAKFMQNEEEIFENTPYFFEPIYSTPEQEKLYTGINKDIMHTISEIELYNEKLYPICEEIRKCVEQQANKMLKDKRTDGFEQIEAILYGSVASGLALEDSDVDITLINISVSSNDEYMSNLLNFGESFKSLAFVQDCKVITTARVPVIKLVFFITIKTKGIGFIKIWRAFCKAYNQG